MLKILFYIVILKVVYRFISNEIKYISEYPSPVLFQTWEDRVPFILITR